jgi:uncharacterized SAM-binding protein YcdF (DUF218 family)
LRIPTAGIPRSVPNEAKRLESGVHHLSKLTTFAFEPLVWLAVIFAIGTFLLLFRSEQSRRWGRRICVSGILFLAFLSWSGLPESLIAEDERQYPAPTDLSKFHGMIVLGGSIASPRIRSTALPSLACSAERVIEPIYLMNRHPNLRMLFTGGDARLINEPSPEADHARALFAGLGVDLSRVSFESASRNTFENATLSRAVPGVDPNQKWLLVTSAWHMTRAKATFERAGWNVTPYPVDFYAQSDVSLNEFSFEDSLDAWRVASREKVGLLVYRLLGRA